jgi:hypothetical protein
MEIIEWWKSTNISLLQLYAASAAASLLVATWLQWRKPKFVLDEQFVEKNWDYWKLKELLKGRKLPAMIVDFDAFERNLTATKTLVQQYKKTVRIATKSIRVPDLIVHIVQHAGPSFKLFFFFLFLFQIFLSLFLPIFFSSTQRVDVLFCGGVFSPCKRLWFG